MIYGPWLGARGFTVGQLAPELAVLAGVQILLRISNFATAQPAREALYTVVEREVSLQVKELRRYIHLSPRRLPRAWAFMGIRAVGASLTAIAFLTIPIAGVWVSVGRTLGRKQRELTDGTRANASNVAVALDPTETEASTP